VQYNDDILSVNSEYYNEIIKITKIPLSSRWFKTNYARNWNKSN